MKNLNAPERAVALVHEALDVLQRAEHVPDSPVNTFLTKEMRSKYRRVAKRLRAQKLEPRYKNLHNAEELANIYERTVQRDEIIEKEARNFNRITMALGRVLEEKDPGVGNAIRRLIEELQQSAEEHGPGSEAALRYQRLYSLWRFGQVA